MQQMRYNKTPHCSAARFKYFSLYFAIDCCDAELRNDSTEVQFRLSSVMECLPSFEPTRLRSSDVELNRLPSSEKKLLANSEDEGSSKIKCLPSSGLQRLPSSEFERLPSFELNRPPCCEMKCLHSSNVKHLLMFARHCSIHAALKRKFWLVPRIHFHSRVHTSIL